VRLISTSCCKVSVPQFSGSGEVGAQNFPTSQSAGKLGFAGAEASAAGTAAGAINTCAVATGALGFAALAVAGAALPALSLVALAPVLRPADGFVPLAEHANKQMQIALRLILKACCVMSAS
jgi:hypothetical protein